MSSPDNNWLPLMLLLTYMAMQNSDGQIESIRIDDPYEKLKSLQEYHSYVPLQLVTISNQY